MENKSSRHHYIPVFFIKRFCNSEGKLFVNDKSNENNYDNISIKVPKSLFFEWDRNTFDINNGDKNIIEKFYSSLESKISPIYDNLYNLSETNSLTNNITVETLRYLIFLGYLTKWRLPIYDDFVEDIDSKISFDDLNVFLGDDNILMSLDNLVHSELSPEIKRLLFSINLFRDKDSYNKVFKRSFIIHIPFPIFLTDNPFVELDIDKDKEYPSFIFPLSSNYLLVSCDYIDKAEFINFASKDEEKYKRYVEHLYKCLQVTLMWQANKFIGCEDKECLVHWLSEVTELSDNLEKVNAFPPLLVFTALNDYKDF
jgi:hypothetical protein